MVTSSGVLREVHPGISALGEASGALKKAGASGTLAEATTNEEAFLLGHLMRKGSRLPLDSRGGGALDPEQLRYWRVPTSRRA
ncbi:MAG: hypothetical protein WKF40_05725 [Thermoleophilaceae bacterium]